MASRPSTTTLSEESAVPTLEWQPYVDIDRVALTGMSVSDGDVAELERSSLEGDVQMVNGVPLFVVADLLGVDAENLCAEVIRDMDRSSYAILHRQRVFYCAQ